MKTNEIIKDIISFIKQINIQKISFIYLTYVILIRIALQVGFYKDDLIVLSIINGISLVVCTFNYLFFLRKKYSIMYFIMIFDIAIFAFFASLFTEGNLLFHTYNIAIIPIIAIYAYHEKFIAKKDNNIYSVTIFLYLVLVFLFFFECFGLKGNYVPLKEFELYYIHLNTFNILVTVMFGCVLFLFIVTRVHYKLDNVIGEIEYTANHDKLTGLENRNKLNEYLEKIKEENKLYCIAIGDIDDFKQINDEYGHLCGDYILKEMSKIFTKFSVSENLRIFRFGGEEIIFVSTGSVDFLTNEITRLKNIITNCVFEYEDNKIQFTMTFGISEFVKDFENTLREADHKLYNGKKNGKNQIVV